MLARLLLIFMIPSFLLYTTPIPPNTPAPPPADLHIPIDPYDESNLTFDQLLTLIETAENPDAISHLSPASLEKLSNLMTTLAKEGILPGQEDLKDEIDADIEDLQAIDQHFAFMTKHPLDSKQYTIDYSQDYKLIRCGWFSKKWKNTCKFARKHKTAIIIGAAAVVVVVAVVATVGAAGGAAAATAAAAASQAPETSDVPAPQTATASADVEKITADYKQQLAKTNEPPFVKGAIDKNISSFKEVMAEDIATQRLAESNTWDDMSLVEKAREVGAHFAHKTFDEVSDLAKAIPQLCQEARDLGEKILPENLQLSSIENAASPARNYESLIARGHQAIDNVFSTDQAGRFTPEAKANDPMNNFAIGMIPLPGSFNKIFSNTKPFREAGKVLDKAGFYRSGRSLMKHGNRKGSVFPKPSGNLQEMNRRGQKILGEILDDPNNKVYRLDNGDLRVYSSDGRGVHFLKDGSFRGFVEKQYEKDIFN